MNGKKAKALRRKIYEENSVKREGRKYKIGTLQDAEGKVRKLMGGFTNVGLRAEYQAAKK